MKGLNKRVAEGTEAVKEITAQKEVEEALRLRWDV